MNTILDTFDGLLWCNECGMSKVGDCHEHGDLIRIKDRVIPRRARLTVPYCLSIRQLELRVGEEHVYGVFAKKVIQTRTQFGPLEGGIVPPGVDVRYTGMVYKIFHHDHTDLLNTHCEDTCNWLMFLRCAKTAAEQNVVAYQYRGQIYFSTTKAVPPGVELRVWYGAEYASRMGIQTLDGSNVQRHQETDYIEDVAEPDNEPEPEEEEFSCTDCGDTFVSTEELDDHVCKEEEEKKRRNKRKGQPMKLGSRMRLSGNKSTNTIKAASKVSRGRKNKLLRIKKRVVEKQLFECSFCGKVFANETKHQIHLYCHTGEKPFKCSYEECQKGFASKFKLVRHEAIHKGDKKHTCVYCEKAFTRKDHLKNHLRIHDSNRSLLKCDFCEKEYSTNYAYKTHLAFHMAEAGDLTCRVCQKEFQNKDDLVYHIKVHAGARSVKGVMEKKCQCPQCDKRFFTMKDVRRHLVVHTRSRNFLCQSCPQSFGRRDHLIRHIKKNHPNESGSEPGKVASQSNEKDLLSQAAAAVSLHVVRNDVNIKELNQNMGKEMVPEEIQHNPQPLSIQYAIASPPPENQQNQIQPSYASNFAVVNNPHRFVNLSALIAGIPSNVQQVGAGQMQGSVADLRAQTQLSKAVAKQYDGQPPAPQSMAYIQAPSLMGQDQVNMNPRYTTMMLHPRETMNPISDTLHTVAMENLQRQHSLIPSSIPSEQERVLLPPDASSMFTEYMDTMKAFTPYPGLTHNPFIPPPSTTPVSSTPGINPQLVDMSSNLYSQPQSFHQTMPYR